MKLLLNPSWESKVALIKPRVYLLKNDFKRLVYKIFDRIQYLECLKFIDSPTFFSFLVFVIWKITFNKEEKDCTMVDIRKLNEFVISYTYYLPL